MKKKSFPFIEMFRALAETFTSQDDFVKEQTKTFTQQLQNPYLTVLPPTKTLQNASSALQTTDPNTRRANLRDFELQKYALSVDLSDKYIEQGNACQTSDIDTLIGSENRKDKVRCGWIYQKGTPGDKPVVSTGYLGTKNGPVQVLGNPPAGRWFWDLEAAKKEVLRDRCNALTTCKNVGSDSYKDCAFSAERGVGVPVQGNQLMYPEDPALRGGNLVFNASACPAPPPPGSPAYELSRSRDVCMPLPDGRLSRDCVLQQVTAAGCKMDGTLYQALVNQALPNNYGAGLEKAASYQRYQRDAPTPLLTSAMKDGRVAVNLALKNFQDLAKETTSTSETALQYAARDLCLKRGVMDEYDFCDDLTDATPSPFAIDCLQKEFRKQGGQPAGSDYPRSANLQKWNSLPNWSAVKRTIQEMATLTKSTDVKKQRDALTRFLGITREAPPANQISPIQGVELFWIDTTTNTFIGRRPMDPKLPDFSTQGDVEKTGLSYLVQYVALTNLRPPKDTKVRLRMETDDGTAWVLNKDLNPRTTRGLMIDNSDTFGRNWDQPPSVHTQLTCWNLKGGGANYLLGTWQQTFGLSHSRTLYSECDSLNFRPIPNEWLTLTQESEAPMFAWEGMRNETAMDFREYRLPSIFAIAPTGSFTIKESSEFPGIPAVLNLTNTAFAKTSTSNFRTSSWRTMTCAFSLKALPLKQTRFLLFGNFSCDIVPRGSTFALSFQWNSATLSTSKTGGILIEGLTLNTPLLAYCNMRADSQGLIPNRLTVGVAPLRDWANGNIGMGSPFMKSITTNANNPLYNKTDSAALQVGHMDNVGTSFNLDVAWIHLFDYELDMNDVARDAKNAWIRVPFSS